MRDVPVGHNGRPIARQTRKPPGLACGLLLNQSFQVRLKFHKANVSIEDMAKLSFRNPAPF